VIITISVRHVNLVHRAWDLRNEHMVSVSLALFAMTGDNQPSYANF